MALKSLPKCVRGRRVLVVEDDSLIAEDLRDQMSKLGATVLGPVSRVSAALEVVKSGQQIDGATVDVTLGREKAFPIADALRARGVPFVFATGDENRRLPEVYQDVPRCGKPVDARCVLRLLFSGIVVPPPPFRLN